MRHFEIMTDCGVSFIRLPDGRPLFVHQTLCNTITTPPTNKLDMWALKARVVGIDSCRQALVPDDSTMVWLVAPVSGAETSVQNADNSATIHAGGVNGGQFWLLLSSSVDWMRQSTLSQPGGATPAPWRLDDELLDALKE